MTTRADRSGRRGQNGNPEERRQRNLTRFSIAVFGSLAVVISLILVLGLLLAGAAAPLLIAAAIPVILLGALMVRVAWAASTGQFNSNDRMALIGGVAVVLIALAVAIWVRPWLGVVLGLGGIFFVGTLYGLTRAEKLEPAEGGPEQRST